MGTICYVNCNPHQWHAYLANMTLKPEYGGEALMYVCYGVMDDDPDGTLDLAMYVRKSIYDKLLDGTYVVDPNSKYQYRLILRDCTGHEITPLSSLIY